jgi:hypothetical protein
MDPTRRAEIIRQSLENLRRFQDESSASVRAAPPPPPEDPVARWRAEGQEFEAMREVRRAEREREGQRDAADLFWQSVDARIGRALEAERAFMTDVMRNALQAVGEAADATADKFSELDVKLGSLAKLLQQLREGNERARAIARAEVVDAPPSPKDLN